MLKTVSSLALFACALGACSSLPTGPTGPVSDLDWRHPPVRPALLPFETPVAAADIGGSIVLPMLPGKTQATGSDPLADDGRHLRVQLTIGAENIARIESVAVGAGTARAYLDDGQDLVVSLIGNGGRQLASVGLRQRLVERVYQKPGARTDRDGAAPNAQHGRRTLRSAAVTVFLPLDAEAERVEVRLGSDKGRVAAEYKLQ